MFKIRLGAAITKPKQKETGAYVAVHEALLLSSQHIPPITPDPGTVIDPRAATLHLPLTQTYLDAHVSTLIMCRVATDVANSDRLDTETNLPRRRRNEAVEPSSSRSSQCRPPAQSPSLPKALLSNVSQRIRKPRKRKKRSHNSHASENTSLQTRSHIPRPLQKGHGRQTRRRDSIRADDKVAGLCSGRQQDLGFESEPKSSR